MNKDGVSVKKKKIEKCSQSEFSKTNEPHVTMSAKGKGVQLSIEVNM